jgi:hypothetical protein
MEFRGHRRLDAAMIYGLHLAGMGRSTGWKYRVKGNEGEASQGRVGVGR